MVSWVEQEEKRSSNPEIASVKTRDAYDQRHAPIGLLKVADCTRDTFVTNRRLSLALLRRELSRFLTAQGEFEKALVFYEKALELEIDRKQTPAYLLLAFQAGKLYFAMDEHQKAYERLGVGAEALEHPGRFGLDDRTHGLLIEDASRTFGLFVNSDVASAGTSEANAYRLIAEAALEVQ